jgi:UrcA family protein
MKKLITIIAAASVTAVAVVAHAQAAVSAEGPSVIVKYSLRDLRGERGPAGLYGKIEAAAESLCEGYRFGHSPAQLGPYRSCVSAILSRTIATLDRPELTAYAATRGVVVGALAARHRGS